MKRGDCGPHGGEVFDVPVTVCISGRGWVTCWSEVHEPFGGIVKHLYERGATDDEVFTAQMNHARGYGRIHQQPDRHGQGY